MRQRIEEWTMQNLWKTVFNKFEVIRSVLTERITSMFLKAAFHKL